MKNILDKIYEYKRIEVEVAKSKISFSEMEKLALQTENRKSFKDAISSSGISIIAELKKASPSSSVIRANFYPISLASELEMAGATALSVLTEMRYFQGSPRYLKDVSQEVKISVLRKDFIFDEYQIAEAKYLGASAVLLIARMLDSNSFKRLFNYAKQLGLDVLAEAHTNEEISMLVKNNADIIGVNCRDLYTFNTDFSRIGKLLQSVPDGVVKVAESGVRCRADILQAEMFGANAVLVGSILMSKESPSYELKKLLGKV